MLLQSNKLLVLGCLHVSCTKTAFCMYHYILHHMHDSKVTLFSFFSLFFLFPALSLPFPLPPSQLHLSSDEGCQFLQVECPLVVFGCQQHSLTRRDLNRHMTDKHTKHMRTVIGESPIRNTLEPPNKGHYGANDFAPCRDVVYFSVIWLHRSISR